MKGVRYPVDGEGKKTHVVLDLSIWQTLIEEQGQTRDLENLRQVFEKADLNTGNVDDVLGDAGVEDTLLHHSLVGLQDGLDKLERDIPQSDLDEWLADFNKA